MPSRKLLVEIIGDDDSLHRALRSSTDATKGFGSAIGGVAKTAAIAAGAAGIGAIALTLKDGYDAWKNGEKLMAQTAAVIKSTGGTAGVTAAQVSDLSTALMMKTSVDDDAIESGQNMLLTFTNIKNAAGKNNDIFTQSTRILTDMTVAMNNGEVNQANMSKQAIQLGKALNDPIKGIGALSKVGVTFTQTQKDAIAAMVKTGDTAGAQRVILKELNKEFGGSAKALGDTLPGKLQILRGEFDNFAQELFTKLVPALTSVLNWVNQHWPQIQAVFSAVFTGIAWAIQNILKPALKVAVAGVQFVVAWVREHWPEIRKYAEAVFGRVKELIDDFVIVVKALWSAFGRTLINEAKIAWEYVKATIKNALEIIRGIIDVITGLIHGDWSKVWKGIQEIVGGTLKQIGNILKTAIKTLGNVASLVGDAIAHGFTALFGWVKRQAISLVNFLMEIIRPAVDAYNLIFGRFTGNIPLPHGVGDGGNAPPVGPGGPIGGPSVRRPQLGGTHVTINVPHWVGSKRDLEDAVVTAMSQWGRRNGNEQLRSVLGVGG